MTKQNWEEESLKSQVVSKIAERLLVPNNCAFLIVSKLNEVVAQNQKVLLYHKMVDRRLSGIKKSISFLLSAILQTANESLKCKKESESSFDHKKVVSNAIDAFSFYGKGYSFSFFSKERSFKICPE